MHFSKKDIQDLERIKRLNLVNSISGVKSANLIGTLSSEGCTNLAIISSVVHLGSDPSLLGFIMRPDLKVRRHSYENILENKSYTINHVTRSMVQNAHYTSAKFEADVSEFEMCALTEEYLFGHKAPFVKESAIKMAMEFIEQIKIKANGTVLMIGALQDLVLPEKAMQETGHIDLDKVDAVGISGLNSYYALEKMAQFPYARVNELPNFNSTK
ncbi:MAG: flavin oxidoreductase [Flavobacteriales bacterium]|nr:flavin oxidoreductase [Flavobacteriales bacterium]